MFFSIMAYYGILNIVPCTIQEVFAVYPSCMPWFATANPKLPIHPSHNLFLLGNHKSVLYVCESVSVSWIGSFVSYFRFHI